MPTQNRGMSHGFSTQTEGKFLTLTERAGSAETSPTRTEGRYTMVMTSSCACPN